MINLDPVIIEFVKNNWLTIGLTMVLLNGLCEIIPGQVDDKIVAVFKRMITFTRQNGGGGNAR